MYKLCSEIQFLTADDVFEEEQQETLFRFSSRNQLCRACDYDVY